MRSHRHDPAVGLAASGVGGLKQRVVRTGPGNTHSNALKAPEVQWEFARRHDAYVSAQTAARSQP